MRIPGYTPKHKSNEAAPEPEPDPGVSQVVLGGEIVLDHPEYGPVAVRMDFLVYPVLQVEENPLPDTSRGWPSRVVRNQVVSRAVRLVIEEG